METGEMVSSRGKCAPRRAAKAQLSTKDALVQFLAECGVKNLESFALHIHELDGQVWITASMSAPAFEKQQVLQDMVYKFAKLHLKQVVTVDMVGDLPHRKILEVYVLH